MKPDDPRNPDRLRDVLHRGDPALGDPGLRPDEIQRMRRAILTAEPEPRRAFLAPAWVTAAATLILAAAFWQLRGPAPIVEPPEPRRRPAETVEPSMVTGDAPAPRRPEIAEPRETAPLHPATVRPARASPAAEPPAVLPEVRARAEPPLFSDPAVGEAGLEEEALPRQVQLIAPGGTRILWVLHSEPISTHEAAPPRPEEKTE